MSLRTYSASFLSCLFIALTVTAFVPYEQAGAQTVPGTTVSTAERTRMYADLARDVAELEKRLGIVSVSFAWFNRTWFISKRRRTESINFATVRKLMLKKQVPA